MRYREPKRPLFHALVPTLLLIILTIGVLSVLVPQKAKAVTIATTPIPFGGGMGLDSYSGWSASHISKLDLVTDLMNSPSPQNDNRQMWTETHGFNGWNVYGNTSVPPLNITVTKVSAILIYGVHSNMNHGWFSVKQTTAGWADTVPVIGWMTGHETYNPTGRAGNYSGNNGWWNSTEFPFRPESTVPHYITWDITDRYAWNITNIQSENLYVLWISNRNTTASPYTYIDYLGLSIEFQYYGGTTGGGYYPEVDVSININGLIWLLVIFFPAMAMNEAVPKLGFTAGIIMMLLILGVSISGFFSVTFMGILAVGIMVYKGE